MVYYGIVNDQQALEVEFHFRESLGKLWNEINKSDAKDPKVKMTGYFGIDYLNI
jgi:hypothetical protein